MSGFPADTAHLHLDVVLFFLGELTVAQGKSELRLYYMALNVEGRPCSTSEHIRAAFCPWRSPFTPRLIKVARKARHTFKQRPIAV
jgi:hypothetical protein